MAGQIDNSDFAIHNRREIVSVLDDLAKHRAPISLVTANGLSMLTAVLGASIEEDSIWLDVSPDGSINDQVLKSGRVSFSTNSGVRVRWSSPELQLVALSDGDAFSIAIPEMIERIQRREYFRLSTPRSSKSLICKIPVVGESGEKTVFEVDVVDMSVGGVGISIKGEIPSFLSEDGDLEGCSVTFPAVGPVTFTLKVCSVLNPNKTRSGEQIHHVGLEFVSLSRGAGNVVQRYMIQLESERISLM